MKMNKLYRTQNDDDSSNDSSDDENDQVNPDLYIQSIPMKSGINRIKSLLYSPIVALWTENGDLNIYDLSNKVDELLQATDPN